MLNKKIDSNFIISIIGLPALLVVFFTIFGGNRFFSFINFFNIIQQSVAPSFVVWGICFVMIMGSYDMTPGVTIILSSMISTLLAIKLGYIGLLLGGILTGLIIGAINGFSFLLFKVPSVILTIGLVMIYEILSSVLSKGRGLYLPDGLGLLSHAPYNLIIWIIGGVIAYFLYNRTTIGLHIQTLGSSEKIAKNAGVNIGKTKLIGFLICAIFGGIGGVFYQSYGRFVQPQIGLTSLLLVFPALTGFFYALAISKRVNIIIAVVVGQLTINLLMNGLIIIKLPTTIQQMVMGALLICVVAFGPRGSSKNTLIVK
ncbi:MAG: hypothetical protein PHU16_03930 [Atribacterota bacterium]|jgi:ribose transport system permease protein|nr:hypothetical protein [Atribacterota bacterium]MDI9594062.1 hypothetical protein [Atribacterota bacterium]HHT11205.1 ABC transporter permease [Candidatus Atribacteria bacterium]